MELMKEQPALEFQQGEVTFLIKPKASGYDRMQVVMAKDTTEFMERVLQQMVTGWKGVTVDGKPAPYSFGAVKLLPEESIDSAILLKLANFVIENTDVARAAKAKNV